MHNFKIVIGAIEYYGLFWKPNVTFELQFESSFYMNDQGCRKHPYFIVCNFHVNTLFKISMQFLKFVTYL